MTKYAPILTLAAVAALGAVLLAVNVVSDPAGAPAPVAAAAPPTAAPTDIEPTGTATTDIGPTGIASPPDTPAAAPPAVVPPAVAERVYAGRSAGDEVTVAVAVRDGRAVAYVCDGKKVEAWLEGTLDGDRLALTGPDGASITGTVDETAAFGTVTAGGTQWPYSAKGVSAPEGLYEGRADIGGVANRIGWIVLDGTQVGFRYRAGERLAPPVLDPADLDGLVVDGVAVPVTTVSGDADVVRS